ncbi:MAG: GNAT family N-acetyltransferase [Candidatus Saganbacteria bacterium]|nr:GNAT family N-acetyltransferase [Candidatus Saganbacteria bacterium]
MSGRPVMIENKRIYLKQLAVTDITDAYINWLNDPEVNRFLSVRGGAQDRQMVEKYVASYDGDDNRLLLGIFDKASRKHIGNITFSSINRRSGVGAIGIAIGDKSFWGKGYGSEALQAAVDLAFAVLKLRRVEAGINAENAASISLFNKAGFVEEGRLKEREKFGDRYVDFLWFGLLKDGKRQ